MNNYETSPENLSKDETLVKEFSQKESSEESSIEEFSKHYFEKVGKYPSEDLLETIRVGINRKFVK